MNDFAQGENPGPMPDSAHSNSAIDVLKRPDKQFNHALFQQRIQELKTAVLDTGGIVFIPLVLGMPSLEEAKISPDNRVLVQYEPDYLLTYSGKEEAISRFDRLQFPQRPNQYNQTDGITAMTDQEGNVCMSLNCPYPFSPTPESAIRADTSLSIPTIDTMQTRIFFAAYLRKMGFDSEFISKAIALQPRTVTGTEGNGYTTDSHNEIMTQLYDIPALRSYFSDQSTDNPEDFDDSVGSWNPPPGITATPEEVYKTMMTTACFQPDGTIAFDIHQSNEPNMPPPSNAVEVRKPKDDSQFSDTLAPANTIFSRLCFPTGGNDVENAEQSGINYQLAEAVAKVAYEELHEKSNKDPNFRRFPQGNIEIPMGDRMALRIDLRGNKTAIYLVYGDLDNPDYKLQLDTNELVVPDHPLIKEGRPKIKSGWVLIPKGMEGRPININNMVKGINPSGDGRNMAATTFSVPENVLTVSLNRLGDYLAKNVTTSVTRTEK